MTRCGCRKGEAGKFDSVHHMVPGCDLVSDEARAAIVAAAAFDNGLVGFCPMGCGQTLIRAKDGHITCGHLGCPRPTAVDELLDERETEHLVRLTERDFSVQHPLRERLDGLLWNCDLHERITALDGPPRRPGTYRVVMRPGSPWLWTEAES